jgi:DNA-binding CsgD family transcriptional regulator
LSATGLELAAEPAGVMSDPSDRLRKRFGLTPAEVRVALILADGFSYAEIAHRLSISPHTVHTHIKEIHQKLGVHTNGRAAALIRSLSYQK